MNKLTFPAALVALSVPAAAQAVTVYPGCAVPALKPAHHTFYIDPVNGSQSGDGSAAKPWHTLAEVLNTNNKMLSTMGHNGKTWKNGDTALVAINPSAPIRPGDVLMLRSGNHGDVKIFNSFNADFVTVMPAPGQTPTLSSLSVVSSGKWLFQGLKVLGAHPTAGVTASVTFGRSDWMGTTSDIILDSSEASATDNTSGWTDHDWQTKTDSYEVMLVAHCLAATNNHLYNGTNGIAFGGDSSIVQSNLITEMYNDGIDFYGSNQIIKNNTIKDGTNSFAAEVLHPDGIQGWSVTTKGVTAVNKNDVVDGNSIIKTGNGKVTQMQGISIFNGLWDGLQIINNVVVSDVYHGIAMYGGKNVSIMNNTVLASDPNFGTWIIANYGPGNTPGTNVVVRNNITSNLVINYPGVTFDHNIAGTSIQIRDAAKKLTIVKSGNVGNKNEVNSAVMNQFVTADPATAAYNLQLRPNSVAISAGSNNGAPQYDIMNQRRTSPISVGAYQQ